MASRAREARPAQMRVLGAGRHDEWWLNSQHECCRDVAESQRTATTPRAPRIAGPPNATPGQSGLPAEFKHINKRRKRN